MLLVGTAQAGAQTDRNLIRQGNRAFKSQKWAVAETQYRKAISKNQKNPQAIYNLGCALMAQQKDSMAIQQFTNAAQLETNRLRRAASYHNMGVIMQNHHEYAQAIEYYKMALRCNPQDNETRYNLALCKKLLKNNPQNKDKNKDNKDKNKDKNKKDQNKDKNKDNKDKTTIRIIRITRTRIRITRIIRTKPAEPGQYEPRECRAAPECRRSAGASHQAQVAEGDEPATQKGLRQELVKD